jgi:O-antigen/teichoic acid export membrane protein
VILENRLLFLCWLATLALLQLIQRTFLGQQRFALYTRVYIINAAAALALLVVLGLRRGVSVPAVARLSIAANALAAACALWTHRNHLNRMRRFTGALLPAVREAYAVGMKGYASGLAFLLLYRLDFFFVAHFLGARALGVYTVAVFVIEAVQKVPDWLGLILTPQIAAIRGDSGTLTRRYATTALAVVASFGLAIAVLARWEGGFFRLALGEGYQGVEAVLLLLIPRAFVHAVMVTYAAYLAGRGYTLYHPLAGLTGVTTLCVVDILAIPHYKLQGAVVGITAAYLVATAVMLLGYREHSRGRLAVAEL